MNEIENIGTPVAWGARTRVVLARPSLAMTNAGHAETRRTVGLASSAARVAGLALVSRARVAELAPVVAEAVRSLATGPLAARPAPRTLLGHPYDPRAPQAT